jgi:hypothetical protein
MVPTPNVASPGQPKEVDQSPQQSAKQSGHQLDQGWRKQPVAGHYGSLPAPIGVGGLRSGSGPSSGTRRQSIGGHYGPQESNKRSRADYAPQDLDSNQRRRSEPWPVDGPNQFPPHFRPNYRPNGGGLGPEPELHRRFRNNEEAFLHESERFHHHSHSHSHNVPGPVEWPNNHERYGPAPGSMRPVEDLRHSVLLRTYDDRREDWDLDARHRLHDRKPPFDKGSNGRRREDSRNRDRSRRNEHMSTSGDANRLSAATPLSPPVTNHNSLTNSIHDISSSVTSNTNASNNENNNRASASTAAPPVLRDRSPERPGEFHRLCVCDDFD